ncbi:MAG TPA: FG-GAP-like repeat-containing protein [Verrucomicrobiae bacterium]|jgi:hypothetical protein|nr:FG-GAP-like repeat-containing protein [Verrucomicrobiae bacterium]
MKKNSILRASLAFGMLVGAGSILAQDSPLYFTGENLTTQSGPATVIPVDLFGDGLPGLVTANFGFNFGANFGSGFGGTGNTLSVFSNDGEGSFYLTDTVTVGRYPVGLVSFDLNGDGVMDLACGNVGDATVSLLINNQDGGFNVAATYPVGKGPAHLEAADVNGDGRVDLICANYIDGTVTVLTNNGHGGFATSSTFKCGNSPFGLAVGDFNGDGTIDLAVGSSDNTFWIFTNNGRGVFTHTGTFTDPAGVGTLAAADVNADGKMDLVTVGGSTVATWINNGKAEFTRHSTVSTPPGTVGAMVWPADFNNDGKIDLVCNNNNNGIQGSGCVFTNDGHGNFAIAYVQPVGAYSSGNYPNYVTAADFNGDGNMDFAVSCYGSATVTTVTQIEQSSRPRGTIVTPANNAVLPANQRFTISCNATSSYPIEVVIYFLDGTNVIGAGTNAPFAFAPPLALVRAGTHGLQAAVIDGNGEIGWTPEVQINVTGTTKPEPTPVISIASPADAAVFTTTNDITIRASTKSVISEVDLYLDNTQAQATVIPPYTFVLPAGSLAPGEHTARLVAVTSGGTSGSSDLIHFTVNTPGTTLIDFDALDTSKGAVGGTTLTKYLSNHGVTLNGVTVGSVLEAVNEGDQSGAVPGEASSAPNFFTQAGLNQPVSFELKFATLLNTFAFTRAGASASSGLVSYPQWTATILDTNGNELGSAGENLTLSSQDVLSKTFSLSADGIAAVRFDSDSQKTAAFSAVLLDDLLLDTRPTNTSFSVTLQVGSTQYTSPATITLTASVQGAASSVSYFSGVNFLGTVTQSPYQLTLTNVLPGTYFLRARVTSPSGISVRSKEVVVTVAPPANSTVINFDTLATLKAAVSGTAVKNYLNTFGVKIYSLTAGTALTVGRQKELGNGAGFAAPSGLNALTQTGGNGQEQFTLSFAPLLDEFGFTRPELLANPFVSHPAWQATAYDGAGAIVGQVSEREIDSAVDSGKKEFLLGGPGGPGIARVQFATQGNGLTTFNGMLLDDLILTTNPAPFPPAVAITKPISGRILAHPPSVTITADAADENGIQKVAFYRGGRTLLGTATASPYTINWSNPPVGNYFLTAVATDNLGLSWTSAVVNLSIRQSASQLGILSEPTDQTVAAGGSVTFTVVATGTNGVTYQWSHNGAAIQGATSSTLVVGPPIKDQDAGSYTVTVTSKGSNVFSDPAILTVVDPPTFTQQPAGATVNTGANVSMDVTATGGGAFTWQWLLNGATIQGATNRTYSILAAQPLQSGNYQVIAANQAASTVSAVAPVLVTPPGATPQTADNFANRISIDPIAGPVIANNQGATVEAGEPKHAGKPGGKSIWFTWRPDFTGTVSLTTAGSDFDTLLAVYTGTDVRRLTAVASDDDSGGYFTSLVTFNVTAGKDYQIAVDGFQGATGHVVLGLPGGTGYRVLSPSTGVSVPVITRGPLSLTVAPNAKVTLSVAATSATKMTYQWHFQGAPINGATGSTFTIAHFQPASVGLYDVLVANAVGSAQSEPATLQISQVLNSGGISAQDKFITSPATGATPAKEAFDLGGIYAAGGDTRGSTISQVFSTVGASREPGEPHPCGQAGGASQWFTYTTPGAGIMQVSLDGSSYNTILGIYTGNGTSFDDLTEIACGYITNSAVQDQPNVVLPNVAKGTKFFIVVDGYQGAEGLAQLHIGVGQPPSIASLPASQLVTAGSTVTFRASALGSTTLSYQWQLNGADVPGATKSTCTIPNAQDDDVGNYAVIVSNVVGVVTSSPPAALTLQYQPAIVTGPSNATVTLGGVARFAVTAIGVNVKTNHLTYQWYFNGAPIPRATAATLAFATRWTNSGTYYVVASNTYGVVTSGSATLVVQDKTRPTVVVKTPANNFVTPNSQVTITGTAADNVGVAAVQLQIDGEGPVLTATGTNNWTITVPFLPGANTFTVQSVDLSGNLSLPVTHKVTYNFAIPAQEKLSAANAAASELAAAAGTYSGLFYPPSGVTVASSGFFSATLASKGAGAFSAYLLLDGGNYPFTGKFDALGNAQTVVKRAGKSPVTASLHLELNPIDDQMTGVISNTAWLSILQADRAVFNAATNPAPRVGGEFALVVPDGNEAPAGYLRITNSAGGTALITGTLADGARLTRTAPMTKDAAIPLYAPLYSGKGLFLGWITFTNSSQTSFGQANWLKPGAVEPTSVTIVK